MTRKIGIVLVLLFSILESASLYAEERSSKEEFVRLEQILSSFKAPYEADVIKAAIARIEWNTMVSDMGRFLAENRFVPYRDPNWGTGLRLETITDPLLRKLGFQEGDVVVGINGMNVGALEQMSTALGILQRATLFNFVVQRNEQIFALYVQVQ